MTDLPRTPRDDQPGLEVAEAPTLASSGVFQKEKRREEDGDGDGASQAPEVYMAWSDAASGNPVGYTFYREGTPTPPEYDAHEKRLGEGMVVAPHTTPLPPEYGESERGSEEDQPRLCGVRKRIFWGVLTLVAIVLFTVAIGVGVGVGLSRTRSSTAT
jgi:hypothetical protein